MLTLSQSWLGWVFPTVFGLSRLEPASATVDIRADCSDWWFGSYYATRRNPFERIGSSGWIRTSNPPVNSCGGAVFHTVVLRQKGPVKSGSQTPFSRRRFRTKKTPLLPPGGVIFCTNIPHPPPEHPPLFAPPPR